MYNKNKCRMRIHIYLCVWTIQYTGGTRGEIGFVYGLKTFLIFHSKHDRVQYTFYSSLPWGGLNDPK